MRRITFFEALSSQSEGVYRSAFEMWLGQIDTVQAGMIYMKPIVKPDVSGIIGDLDLDDLFTLAAILQHGSLLPEEHAAVFHFSREHSQARLDELLGREIIEKEPKRPGFRVRPEVNRVVQEALYRQNLL